MENIEGRYIVMWHIFQKVKKKGIWSRFIGKPLTRLKPIINRYDTEEIAEYGFKNIKSNGGIRPYLFKVIKE